MKNVSILPSLLTTGNLFCGAFAMVLALNNKIYSASWFLFVAMFFDLIDGQVARLKNVATKFGMEYDSLADLISFGCAPAIMVYTGYLKDTGRMGIALFFIYIACTALRLARFNTQKASQQKVSFVGLPSPASSGFIASVFILNNEYSFVILAKIMPVLILILSALMISNFEFPAVGILSLWKKKPFVNLVALILFGMVAFLHFELALFLCFFGYVLSGLFGIAWKKKFILQTLGKGVAERSGHEAV